VGAVFIFIGVLKLTDERAGSGSILEEEVDEGTVWTMHKLEHIRQAHTIA
jgi:hypothetical protein